MCSGSEFSPLTRSLSSSHIEILPFSSSSTLGQLHILPEDACRIYGQADTTLFYCYHLPSDLIFIPNSKLSFIAGDYAVYLSLPLLAIELSFYLSLNYGLNLFPYSILSCIIGIILVLLS